MKNKLFFMFLSLMTAALAFSYILYSISYGSLYTNIFVSSQKIEVNRTVEKINFASRLGKPVEYFYGIEDILKEIIDNSDCIRSARICGKNENLLYIFPQEENPESFKINQGSSYTKSGDFYYAELSIEGGYKLGIILDGKEIGGYEREYRDLIFKLLAIIFLTGMVMMAVLLYVLNLGRKAMVSVMLVSQIIFGIFNCIYYYRIYADSIDRTISVLDRTISRDIRRLENAGIPRDEFYLFDEYLAEIADSMDIELAITTEYNQGAVLLPNANVYITLGNRIINNRIFEYLLDSLILCLITLFLSIEILLFFNQKKTDKGIEVSVPMVRLMFFSMYFALSLSAAFITVIAYRMSEQYGTSLEFHAGLPVSAELIAILIAIFISGNIIGRLGIRNSLLLCAFLGIISFMVCAFAKNLFIFTGARILMGFSFGFLTIIGRVIASSIETTEAIRSKMLTALTAGIMIGCCCGTITGGTLASNISFEAVFLIGAVLTALCIPLIIKCRLGTLKVDKPVSIFGFIKRIFDNKSMMIYLIALVLPCFGAGVFISFSVPFLGTKNGLPINVISALIMLNMLLAAYLAPLTVKICSNFSIIKKSAFYGLLTGIALGVFCFMPDITGLVITVVILGIADSFGIVTLIDGFSRLRVSRKRNSSYNMIIFTLFGKAGQFIALQTFVLTEGLPVFLAVFAITGAVIFILASKTLNSYEQGA